MTLPADICVSQSGPSSVTQLFERAFGEEGFHKENRPRAQEWISQLDVLRDGLRNCNQNPAHKYHKISRTCPWCDLENTSGVLYFLTYANTSQTQTTFDLKDVWSKIKAVKIPSLDKLPDVNSIQIVPTPLPEYAKPPRGLLGIVNFFLNFHNDGGERKNREFALRQAEQEWQSINRQWQALEFDSSFNSNYRGLQKAYNEYKNLPNQYQVERKATLLKIYLDRYFIENSEISNIGKKRALVLASYGVETAADVSYDRISSIPGFGPVLTQKLVEWRNTLEIRFQQCRPSPRDLASLNGIDQKYARRRSELENKLMGGKTQLEYDRDILSQRRKQVRKEAENIAKKLAQAQANMGLYT